MKAPVNEHVKNRLSLVPDNFNESQLQVTFPNDPTGKTAQSFCATLSVYGYAYNEIVVDNKVMSVIVTHKDPAQARFMVLGALLLVLGKQPTLNDYRNRVNIFNVDDKKTWETNLFKCVSHYLDQVKELQPWTNIVKAILNSLTDAQASILIDLANYTKETGCKPVTLPATAATTQLTLQSPFRQHPFFDLYRMVTDCKVVYEDLAKAKGLFKLFGKVAQAQQKVENISEKLLMPYSPLVSVVEKTSVPSLQ